MDCTEHQKHQLESLLQYAFNELQLRCSQRNLKAVAALAYACHHLPSADRNPFFDFDYFVGWFTVLQDEHGILYDYLGMLDAIRNGRSITHELATNRWGTGLGAWPMPDLPHITAEAPQS